MISFRLGVCILGGGRLLDVGGFLVSYDRERYKIDFTVTALLTTPSSVETVRL